MPRPRVVLVAPLAPYTAVPHAGGRYLDTLCRELALVADLHVIVPGTRTNRVSATMPGAPPGLLLVGLEPGRGHLRGALNRVALNTDRRLRVLDPGMPYLPLIAGLLTSRATLSVVRSADVIDLQWSDSIRLARLLRRLNRRARVTGTFHDVVSQSLEREPAESARHRLAWRLRAGLARRHERSMVRALDEVLVFSAKDAELLGSPPAHRVVHPPLVTGREVAHVPGPPECGTVLVVSYLARPENDRAARWLLDAIWPAVRARLPDVVVRLVGAGASSQLRELAESGEGVTLAGYVDDLEAEYARATVCLVPLREGAGVKFKTIEALLHGVPVVTTPVGAEGIDGDGRYVVLADDEQGLVDRLVEVLAAPAEHQERADRAQAWAVRQYGLEQFRRAVLPGPDGAIRGL